MHQFIKTSDGWYDLIENRIYSDEEHTKAITIEEKPKRKKSGEQTQ